VTRRDWLIVALFAVALLPRLFVLSFGADSLQYWEYETLANNIASGNGYVISRFGRDVFAFGDGNLYSFLAGAFYALFGHHPLALAAVQACLASLAIPVLYVIAERPFGMARAALGATLAAFHPGLLVYTLKLHPLGLDVLLLSLMVCWTLRRGWSRRASLLAALTLGLSLMSRPTFFVAGMAALFVRWLTGRMHWRYVALTIAVALIVPLPWIARNWLVLGEPILSSTSFEDVWKGNNQLASGSGFISPSVTPLDAAPPSLRQQIFAADELQANRIFAQETFDFIQQQPRAFVGLVVRKFFYFWWLPEQAGLLYPADWLARYQVYALVVDLFAALGAIGIVRNGTSEERDLLTVVATVAVALAAVHALAYVDGRHRWGIEPLLLLVAARGMFTAATWARGQLGVQSGVLRRLSAR